MPIVVPERVIPIPARAPLELAVEVVNASGAVTRWDGNARSAGNVPRGITFNTKRGDGFADGPQISLARRIDQDWPDINLFDTVRLVGGDGSIAYEGYIAADPRSFDAGHTVSVRVAGPMTLAQQQPFSEVYIDRDLSKWAAPSNRRKIALVGFGDLPTDPTSQADPANQASLGTEFIGPWTNPGLPVSEAAYTAPPGVTLGQLYYEWTINANVASADTNWSWFARLADDDTYASADTTANLRAAGPGSGTLTATAATRTVAMVQLSYAAAAGSSITYAVYWRNLAVIGNHGLTLQPSSTPGPGGLLVSDMISDICSRFTTLDPSGVIATNYPVDNATFEQSQPYDAFLALNKYHLWELAVWENRVLHYYPADLSDYTWQVRLDDPGVTVDLPGDSTEQLANGIVVSYQDIQTGMTQVLTPLSTPALADPNPLNPATLHGQTVWTTLDLTSEPFSAANATQIGIAKLAEVNQAKAIGTIKVRGHIRDRAGNWQPGWKVRASDTIALVNHPDDRPRLIGETSWDQDSLTLTIAVDNTLMRVDAFMDRLGQALAASNVGTFPTN